jgi:WD40 repeat protein
MRGFLITILLGLGLFAGVAWYLDLWPHLVTTMVPPPETAHDSATKVAQELGPELYKPVPLVSPARDANDLSHLKDPIVIDGHLVVTEKQEVSGISASDNSSKRSQRILFIGEPIPDDAPAPPGPVYAAKINMGDKEVVKRYRRLEEGARVKQDQIVGMLDYSLALNDATSKKTKIDAAKADLTASIKTKLEVQSRLDRMNALRQQSAKFVTPEEYDGMKLQYDRYYYEEEAKRVAVTQAEIDYQQAEIILKEHEIRNRLPGISILKTIYKHAGEAVKELDPVLQLFNIDRLRAEGLVEVQYFDQLREGMTVSLEPREEAAPLRVLNEHRGEVNAVAVSGHEKNPLIVSASHDGTVRVWNRMLPRAVRVLYHPASVRSVACSPRGAKKQWLLTGCSDGTLRLYDLDRDSDQPVWDSTKGEQTNPHRDAITALAFSPDGTWFATGGEDNTIGLWQTEGAKLLYPFDAEHGVDNPHQGTITALHFTPQCQLVSASRDNTLRVWELRTKGAHLVGEPITGRGGSVGSLGVSADGAWALLDKGKMLQVISLVDRRTQSVLQNPSGATPFETLALFSPDARLIMTAGAAEGRLQLWRSPTDGKRGFEVRQLAPLERSPVTCAAFAHDAGIAPDGSFAVSGTKDGYVYIWPVPNREKVSRHCIENLKLTLIENSLDSNTRQVRIGVNVLNPINDEYPTGRLMPGRPVNIVIEPQ